MARKFIAQSYRATAWIAVSSSVHNQGGELGFDILQEDPRDWRSARVAHASRNPLLQGANDTSNVESRAIDVGDIFALARV
jgi:hypothetical protein